MAFFCNQIELKDKTISDYESQLTSARQLHAETKKELSRLEEHHRDIQNELGTSGARRENLEHNVSIGMSSCVL
jgi:septal ring factor EnvC (AmiA/AmiB activator)